MQKINTKNYKEPMQRYCKITYELVALISMTKSDTWLFNKKKEKAVSVYNWSKFKLPAGVAKNTDVTETLQ